MPPPSIIQIVLGLCVAYYSFVMLGLTAGLRRLKGAGNGATPLVSVIVAARNEESNIAGLLECLAHQDYPNYEILIVNDRSTDGTASLISQGQKKYQNLRRIDILSADPITPPKKNALAHGIAESRGDILCFTDADCLPPPRWIKDLVAMFDDHTGLVAGYSPYSARGDEGSRRSPLSQLLLPFTEYEEFKGAVWAAGSIGWNLGWLCTGRSLAYRRRVYEDVGGFEKIKQSVSGDDDLFLQLVRRETKWSIRYLTTPTSFVPTYPPVNLSQFLNQRVRHFSAGKFFPLEMKAFFLLFHTANLMIVLSLLSAILQPDQILLWPYLVKFFVDALLFFSAAPVFRQMKFSFSFPLLELLYIIYNSLVGPLGFVRRFEWKPGPP